MKKILQDYTIAFDLDGTLVDTAPDLVRATNEILDILKLPNVEESAMRKIVGKGAKISITKAAGLYDRELSEEEISKLLPIFLDSYKNGIAVRSRVYDGVKEVLQSMKDHGAKLVVCTNKPNHLSELVLTELDLIDYFLGIYGPESTPRIKPDPIHLVTAIEGVGGNCKKAMLIGDSENDVIAAQMAKVPVIVTSFGYTTKKAPDLGADAFFDHYDELFDIVLRYIK